ncbi:MAG: hypothetical protein KDD05_04830, partial [Psychroserpens sp.]|nr:hypothetical protein [Psychroserpens sp.]
QYFLWCLDYNGKAIGILKNFLSPKYDYKSYYGFDGLVVSESQTEQFKKSLLIKSTYDCDKEKGIHPLAWKYINDIAKFCNKTNKTLILLTTPTYEPECKIQYEILDKKLDSIGVNYKDYSGFFVQNNDITFWKDKTHLSSKGAAVFTEFLKQDLQDTQETNH